MPAGAATSQWTAAVPAKALGAARLSLSLFDYYYLLFHLSFIARFRPLGLGVHCLLIIAVVFVSTPVECIRCLVLGVQCLIDHFNFISSFFVQCIVIVYRVLCTVWCLGFGIESSGVRFQSCGFRVQSSGFRVQGSGFRVQGSGCRVQGPGFRVV